MRETKGWSYTRIASELDVPVTTVEALLHRARRALRREFLSVSGGSRLAGLPVLGWLSIRAGRIRTRIGVAWEASPVTQVLAPAVAGVAAITFAMAPMAPTGGGSDQGSQPAASAPPALYAPADEVLSSAPAAPEQAPSGPTAAPPSEPPTAKEPPPPPPPPPPDQQLGPVHIYTSPEGTAYADQQAEQMPIHIPFGEGTLGVDPEQLVKNLLKSVVPGSTNQ